jgi:ATP-dependent helicase/nuclease subunit A
MTINNTIIEAGAGTGKTYTIMQLLAEGLKSQQFEIDNVAVITFTRKAAAELKERVMKMLQEEASKGNELLQSQLLNIANAHITTIHSFCESLLKSLPVEAGIDPGFQIIEEAQTKDFFEKVFDRWITARLEDNPEELQLLCLDNNIPFYPDSNNPYHKSDKSLYTLLKSVIRHRELKLFEPAPPVHTFSELKEQFEKDAKQLIGGIVGSEKLTDALHEYLFSLMSIDEKMLSEDSAIINSIKYKPGNLGGKAYTDAKNEWKTLCEKYISEIKFTVLYPQIKKCYLAFNTIGDNFCKYYREEMRLAGVMDFTEILIKTEELLSKHRDAREYFKNKFKFLFVDEFQDTDPIQTHILFFLAEKTGEYAENWEDVNLAENKICVVGDPKQSIYRFRRADIEIYSEVADKIEKSKSGKRETLKHSYRSAGKVLDWINDFFTEHLHKPANGNWQVDYKPIAIAPKENREKGNAPNKNLDNAGEVIFVESDIPHETPAKDWKVDPARECEAKITAKWIKEYGLQHGEYKDILVLYRKKKNMQATAEMLEELGIPCEVVGGKSFFARQEILDMNLFLRAVSDPLDVVSIVATLRGPFFSITDAELCEWKLDDQDKHHFAYNGKITESFKPDHIVSKALIKLKELHKQSQKTTAHELLKNELTEQKLLASYRSTWHGARSVMNIIKVLELLKGYNHLPCAQAVEELTENIESNSEMADFSKHTGKNDAVRLMTIHKAKGLQSKVVYLADTTSSPFPPDGTYIDNRQGILYYTLALSSIADIALPEMIYRKALENEKINAEESRLRYVAATRVIDTLVINHRPRDFGKQHDETIYRPLEKDCDETIKVNISGINPDYQISSYTGRGSIDFVTQWNDRKQIIDQNIKSISEPTMKIISPASAESEDIQSEFDVKIVYDPSDYTCKIETKDAQTVGVLVHKLLELHPETKEEAAKFAKILTSNCGAINTEILLERYYNIRRQTDKICLNAKNILREVPIKYRDSSGIYFDGIIDLLIEQKDGWVIVDYKVISANYTDEELRRKYSDQFNIYAEGLKQIGFNIKETILLRG